MGKLIVSVVKRESARETRCICQGTAFSLPIYFPSENMDLLSDFKFISWINVVVVVIFYLITRYSNITHL